MTASRSASDTLVIPLNGAAVREDVGGKAYNLALLAEAGLPTPRSLVVTSRAWELFVRRASVLRGASLETAEALRAHAIQVRDLFTRTELPAEVEAAVDALRSELLGECPVAVRSSAVAEDSRAASFAGQFRSFLNVSGRAAIASAIRDCWLNGVSEQLVEYQIFMKIREVPLPLAVLVQEMLHATSAGVYFSRNPISRNPAESWLTSSWGLGTSVVDGSVKADNFVLSQSDGRVLTSEISDKREREDVDDAGGLTRSVVGESLRWVPSITADQVADVWRLGRLAEQVLGQPVDLEWAVVPDGTVVLLQARPITTGGA